MSIPKLAYRWHPFLLTLLIICFVILASLYRPYQHITKQPDSSHLPGGDVGTYNFASPSTYDYGIRYVDAYPNNKTLWYRVHLNTDKITETNQGSTLFLIDILQKLLDLPMVGSYGKGATYSITHIVYDTSSYTSKAGKLGDLDYIEYDADVYIAVKGFSLDLTKIYKNEIAEATLEFVPPSTIPYIQNTDYCETDGDCTIRTSFCGYGSFNRYENYADVWGCESPAHDLESLNADGLPTFTDEAYDASMGCRVKASYSGVSCVNHSCKGIGRKLMCSGN